MSIGLAMQPREEDTVDEAIDYLTDDGSLSAGDKAYAIRPEHVRQFEIESRTAAVETVALTNKEAS